MSTIFVHPHGSRLRRSGSATLVALTVLLALPLAAHGFEDGIFSAGADCSPCHYQAPDYRDPRLTLRPLGDRDLTLVPGEEKWLQIEILDRAPHPQGCGLFATVRGGQGTFRSLDSRQTRVDPAGTKITHQSPKLAHGDRCNFQIGLQVPADIASAEVELIIAGNSVDMDGRDIGDHWKRAEFALPVDLPRPVLSATVLSSVHSLDGTVRPERHTFTVHNGGSGELRYTVRAVSLDGGTPSSLISVMPGSGTSSGNEVEHRITILPERIAPASEQNTVETAIVLAEDASGRVSAQALYVIVWKNLIDLVETRLQPDEPLQFLAAFGTSVGIADDYAVVTAAGSSARSAYVFRPGPSGWRQEQRIRPLREDLGFGRAVAAGSNRIAVVGDKTADIYQLSGDTAILEDQLDCQSVFRRCTDVALDGAFLSFTADALDFSSGVVGSVPVYRRSGGTRTREWTFYPPPDVGANFLGSVSLDGGRLIVGIPFFNPGFEEDPGGGLAVIYRRAVGPIRTTWLEEARLGSLGSGPALVADQFGAAVSISDDLVAVGTPDRHEAHVFRYDGDEWVREWSFRPLDGVNFGASVALDGDRLVVGAPNAAGAKSGLRGADRLPGAAYVYRRVMRDGRYRWIQEAKLANTAGDYRLPWVRGLVNRSHFGTSVDQEGARIIVGANRAFVRSGAAFLYQER